jgi:hypothetical protein
MLECKKIFLFLLIIFFLKSSLCIARTPASLPVQTTANSLIPVQASLVIDKIENLNTIEQTFKLHATLITQWVDTRLRNHVCTAPTRSKKSCTYIENAADEIVNKIWHPDLRITNISNKISYRNQKLIIFTDGKVFDEVQFTATVHSILNLRNMPFDQQKLFIDIQSFSWDAKHLLLQIKQVSFNKKANEFIQSWRITHYNHHCSVEETLREHKNFYKCTIQLDLKRLPHYFLLRFIAPTFLFVIVSWLSFIAAPNDRMRLSLSCLFTLVAYELYVTSQLPNIEYVTKVDLFFILSIITIGILILYHAIEAKRSRDAERKEKKQLSSIANPLPLYWRAIIIVGYFLIAILIVIF